jgi:minichromosome maintenance protein 10
LVRTGGRERTPGGFKGFGEEHVGEKLGRGRAERKKRQREEREAEEALRRMVDKGSTGGKYLAVIERHRAKDAAGDDKGGIKDRKGGEDEREVESKRPFSADTIKRIGFDPTRIAGRENEAGKRRKAESIAILKEPGRGFEGTKRVKRGSMRTPSGGLRKDEGEDAGGPKALGSPGPADRLVDLD